MADAAAKAATRAGTRAQDECKDECQDECKDECKDECPTVAPERADLDQTGADRRRVSGSVQTDTEPAGKRPRLRSPGRRMPRAPPTTAPEQADLDQTGEGGLRPVQSDTEPPSPVDDEAEPRQTGADRRSVSGSAQTHGDELAPRGGLFAKLRGEHVWILGLFSLRGVQQADIAPLHKMAKTHAMPGFGRWRH